MKIFVTGSAGFIGYHLCKLLIADGHNVVGFDGMTDYYDVALKHKRHEMLLKQPNFRAIEGMLEDQSLLDDAIDGFACDTIVHLAAQAGVRYSLENPRAYIDSNIVGTFNVMEAARRNNISHLLMASTSSVYGANEDMPFNERTAADTPLTIYAATKKATEALAHSYAHLWSLPTTMFRFFTVYGPWGRPDLALFKFVKAMVAGEPIDVYNHGDMYRDFTFVGDLVKAISLLIKAPPVRPKHRSDIPEWDSLSPVAPFRVVNIGNSEKVRLSDFIDGIEKALGIVAERRYLPIQPGDVPATWADATLLQNLTGYRPQTDFQDGIAQFVSWYRNHYSV